MPFNVIVDPLPQLAQVAFDTVQAVPSTRPAVRLKLCLQFDLRLDDPQQATEQRRSDDNERHEVVGTHGVSSGAAGGMKSKPSNPTPNPG